MIEARGNIWNVPSDWVICITTNGSLKKDGRAVMGAGCAKEACMLFNGLDVSLGKIIKAKGNHVWPLAKNLYSFPVKHNWWEKADLELIKRSCRELVDTLDTLPLEPPAVVLPRPGCGNGQLSWNEVRPVLLKEFHRRKNILIFTK